MGGGWGCLRASWAPLGWVLNSSGAGAQCGDSHCWGLRGAMKGCARPPPGLPATSQHVPGASPLESRLRFPFSPPQDKKGSGSSSRFLKGAPLHQVEAPMRGREGCWGPTESRQPRLHPSFHPSLPHSEVGLLPPERSPGLLATLAGGRLHRCSCSCGQGSHTEMLGQLSGWTLGSL